MEHYLIMHAIRYMNQHLKRSKFLTKGEIDCLYFYSVVHYFKRKKSLIVTTFISMDTSFERSTRHRKWWKHLWSTIKSRFYRTICRWMRSFKRSLRTRVTGWLVISSHHPVVAMPLTGLKWNSHELLNPKILLDPIIKRSFAMDHLDYFAQTFKNDVKIVTWMLNDGADIIAKTVRRP